MHAEAVGAMSCWCTCQMFGVCMTPPPSQLHQACCLVLLACHSNGALGPSPTPHTVLADDQRPHAQHWQEWRALASRMLMTPL